MSRALLHGPDLPNFVLFALSSATCLALNIARHSYGGSAVSGI